MRDSVGLLSLELCLAVHWTRDLEPGLVEQLSGQWTHSEQCCWLLKRSVLDRSVEEHKAGPGGRRCIAVRSGPYCIVLNVKFKLSILK